MVRGVKLCPKCHYQNGSAAKLCPCGYNFHAARLSTIRVPSATSGAALTAIHYGSNVSNSGRPVGTSGAYVRQASLDAISPGQVTPVGLRSFDVGQQSAHGQVQRLQKPGSFPPASESPEPFKKTNTGSRAGTPLSCTQAKSVAGSLVAVPTYAASRRPSTAPYQRHISTPSQTATPIVDYGHAREAMPSPVQPSIPAEYTSQPSVHQGPMSAVRLYGLQPHKKNNAETVLFTLSIDAGDGGKQRCFVALDLSDGAASNDGHACTHEDCCTAKEPIQHPLSIAAILDLHCAHIEYCKTLQTPESASPCDITLEGYRQLVMQYGKQDALYELGYSAIMEQRIPLLQRAADSVYIVYCGVTKESPMGFVHVDVSYDSCGRHIVQCECNKLGSTEKSEGKPCLHQFSYMWYQASNAVGGERTAFTYLPPLASLESLTPAAGRGGP